MESLLCHLLRADNRWQVRMLLEVSEGDIRADPMAEEIKSDSRGRQLVFGTQGQVCRHLYRQS